MTEAWTIRRVLGWTAPHFEKHGVDSPRLTAEVLLAHVLKTDRVRLYIELDRQLTKEELSAFRAFIERRSAGEPTQYLTGVKEFYNRRFQVDPRVLIPRPETELLVESVLRELPEETPSRVLDLCTGSGCIAVTIAAERQKASVWATDVSKEACEVARGNAEANGAGARLKVLEGDLFGPLPSGARFDVITANPPYIESAVVPTLSREVQREPRLALDGGADGLCLVRGIASGAREWLKPGGLLALEISEGQGDEVRRLLTLAGCEQVRVEKDLARLDRLAFGRRPAGLPRES